MSEPCMWTKEPTTDEEAKQYIPQDPATQNQYDLYRLRGDNILDALIETLRDVTGTRDDPAPGF
jgi:hypothetical protein